jgi:hypothetical protein
MGIKFSCGCGKRLRVAESMAGRRLMCPRCGSPVGVPSLRPTHTGTEANVMTPDERRRLAHLRARRAGLPAAGDADTVVVPVQPVSPPDLENAVQFRPPRPAEGDGPQPRKRRPRRRRAVAGWYDCLAYPFRAWPLLVSLATALTTVTGAGVLLLPQLYDPTADTGQVLAAGWVGVFLLLGLAGYTAGFLDCTLASALAGQAGEVRWPGANVFLVVKSLVRWLLCFLTGPALLAAAGYLYWLHCGDMDWLDWIILGEIAVGAAGYALLALAASNERDRLRDANPLRVLELGDRLGYRALILAVAAAAVVLGCGWYLSLALEELHREVVGGWLLLAMTWTALLFLTTFLLRLLGLWCRRCLAVPATA